MRLADPSDLVNGSADTVFERADTLAADFATRAAEHDRDGSFPFENFQRLAEAGMLNLTLPRAYGGQELGLAAICRVIQRIAAGDASTALVLAMQYMQHALLVRESNWPRAVYEQVCRESVEGIALMNSLRVEPELGTPARGGLPATTATESDQGWRISGHKIYSTGAPILRWMTVWARTADIEPRVGLFLVPADSDGVRIVETWDHLGMRATGSHDVLLEQVAIPAEFAVDVRFPNAWPRPSPLAGAWNALILSALYHGVACAARDWLVGYLHQRVPTNLGAPLASLPRFQSAVGEIQALLYASERLLYDAAAEADLGQEPLATSPMLVTHIATNNAIRAVEIGLALIGNPGLTRHNPLERHYRDALCSRIHSPQDDVILAAAGREALGIGSAPSAPRKEGA